MRWRWTTRGSTAASSRSPRPCSTACSPRRRSPTDLRDRRPVPAGRGYQQVGGDWYDAFAQPDGATVLVIGDVVGHNVDAAAAMGQIRSILRGIAYDRPGEPGAGPDPGRQRAHRAAAWARWPRRCSPASSSRRTAAAGLRTLRWSSAGHLPPLLLLPDGDVELLDTPPERLLGAEAAGRRSDHQGVLRPGDTVVLYTDGLVENGRAGIDEGIERLSGELTALAGLPLGDLCDRLLERLVPGRADDDIAVLAVRARPENEPPAA